MIRSSKKMKAATDLRSGHIHSGNLMTSYLHEQTDYNVTIKLILYINNFIFWCWVKTQLLKNEMPIASPDALNNEVPVNALNADQEDLIEPQDESKLNGTLSIVNNSESQVAKSLHNSACVRHACQAGAELDHTRSSISGGLTLNKTNKSLKNLIYYIKTAYSINLTSPKWKNFKGLKLQVVEKIRLNNVIW